MLTAQGEKLMAESPGVTQVKEKDGTNLYFVPLAERRRAGVSKITMSRGMRVTVEYTWRWDPNKLGNLFLTPRAGW